MPDPSRTTVYLVDDQAMIRAAFRGWLARSATAEVVGEAGDPRTAIVEIGRLKPDLVLLDITMVGLSGIDALPAIKSASPHTRVLMMSHHEGAEFVQQSMAGGANGYLTKDSDPAEFEVAIKSVMAGRPYISPKVLRSLAGDSRRGASDADPRAANARELLDLTSREREVLLLLAIGKSNKEVARELKVTVSTAKKHRENLQRKLGCHSTAELAALAIRGGLLAGD